ncbi:MAG: tripartite tricarboxylate transporter substrate binding protein [Betaproteobacteria bacterium]|nr:tripartite tricarboxylate transporter substrate binding protein [Betaproteobacteria bacterium]
MNRNPLRRALVAAALVALALPTAALAQSFPTRAIKIIVPLAAGGTGDTLARTVAEAMSKELGQPVVIENKPGAGGLVGAEAALQAPADGYTLIAVSPSHIINPLMHADKKTYDPLRSFEPVTVIANTHQMIVAHPSAGVKNMAELIDYAKKNPGKLNYGSAGTGSATHLNMEMVLAMAGIDIVHVPYKGSTQARQDVLAGQVQLASDGLLPLQPLIKDGRLVAIGLMSSKRAQSNPEIPTIGETVKGYASDTWYGLLVPAGVPKDVIAKLNAAAVKGLTQPATKDRFQKLGADTVGNSPEEFRALLESDHKTWSKVVKDLAGKLK